MARLSQAAVAKLPHEEAKCYFDEWGADIRARLILCDLVEAVYVGPGDTTTNDAVASLWHAIYYLEDRIGYEMHPAPKGMILLTEDADV